MGLLDGLKSMMSGGRLDVASRFEILREAISGTMSSTCKARDRRTNQVVALKVLNLQKTREFEARFKGLKKPTEGEIAVKLKHPNIVVTHEHGLTTKGEQYLIMEFIEGPGLNSLIIGRNEKVLGGIRVTLLREIAEAIDVVHKEGYIHRDICPRNLMIEPNDGVLKLIDFGLTVPATPEFMLPGNRTGTPNYMAPELIKRQPTDQRLDVFAFGVTAFELMTYELPWERGTTGQVAMTHAARPPADIRKLCPNINRRLAKAIEGCLERDPANRCKSMGEFLKAIKNVESEYE
ncbi:MAG: serine/threonine-protein kinase [Pirellulales bacterium]|nr:serine/threonine protein kinase [Planctomycetales bacterium]